MSPPHTFRTSRGADWAHRSASTSTVTHRRRHPRWHALMRPRRRRWYPQPKRGRSRCPTRSTTTRGIGRFHGVGKFESLDGVDVRAALAPGSAGPTTCTSATTRTRSRVGEWVVGAGRRADRRRRTHPRHGGRQRLGRPRQRRRPGRAAGRAGTPSARRRCAARGLDVAPRDPRSPTPQPTGDRDADVREIADRARAGEPAAQEVLAYALRSLGRALAAPISDFGAELVVVGGSMSGSWDLFEPWFREGAGDIAVPPVRTAVARDAARAVRRRVRRCIAIVPMRMRGCSAGRSQRMSRTSSAPSDRDAARGRRADGDVQEERAARALRTPPVRSPCCSR